MIRKAVREDLDKIMVIIEETIAVMEREGNPQWDDNYPRRTDFQRDIEENTLYVFADDGDEIKGLVCINDVEMPEYEPLDWSCRERALILHRMAVAPSSRREGIGSALLALAEELAAQQSVRCLKTDTYCDNDKMNGMFLKKGYSKIGEVHFGDIAGHFNCYEKILV